MAKVEMKVAAKDYPDEGITKGDTYYTWQLYKQPVRRSKTRPRPSQLTGSDKLSRAYAAQEALVDALRDASSPEDICQALDEAAAEVREVGEEYGASADNMEEAFPGGSPTIDECREKQEAMEEFAQACDDAKVSIEALTPADIDSETDESLGFDDCPPGLQAEWLDVARDECAGVELNV